MHPLRATPRYARAIEAVAELLTRLRLDFLFLGVLARSAWIGGEAASGSIDVLAAMGPQSKNQVAMMASNCGFRVDRDEIEQSEELDLIPLNLVDDEGEIKVHVLVASNALYGRMIAAGVPAAFGERTIKMPTREDFALLLAMSGDDVSLAAVMKAPEFDHRLYNETLVSIGLKELVV